MPRPALTYLQALCAKALSLLCALILGSSLFMAASPSVAAFADEPALRAQEQDAAHAGQQDAARADEPARVDGQDTTCVDEQDAKDPPSAAQDDGEKEAAAPDQQESGDYPAASTLQEEPSAMPSPSEGIEDEEPAIADPGHSEPGDAQELYNFPTSRGMVAMADPSSSAYPRAYDARTEGLVSPVRYQEPWGACWAFGPLAAMEANLVKQGLIDQDTWLSPRHLIYFAGTPAANASSPQQGEGQHPSSTLVSLYGENAVFEMGGHALEVASAISSGEGVTFETRYPYRNNEEILATSGLHYAKYGTWSLPEAHRFESAFQLKNMHRLPNPATFGASGSVDDFVMNYDALDAVKQAILDYGAVSMSYCSYHGEAGHPNFYNDEFATYFTNSTTAVDHDVCIVGWDDDFPAERFTTGANGALPEGNGAWIVKNSWGSVSEEFPNRNDWGEEGYCYLSYYDRSAQGFTAWEMMSSESPEASSITNQHDFMGQRSNSETRVADYAPQASANIFTAVQTQELSAVSVNTYAPGTEVEISLYLLSDSGDVADPRSGKLLETKSCICEWGGYHRIALDGRHLVYEGQRFSVVVSMAEVGEDGTRIPVASIEAGNNIDSMATFGLSHYDTVICNVGETMVLADHDGDEATSNLWLDGTEFARMLHEGARDAAWYGNACIKVFANPSNAQPPKSEPEPVEPVPDPEPESKAQSDVLPGYKPDSRSETEPERVAPPSAPRAIGAPAASLSHEVPVRPARATADTSDALPGIALPLAAASFLCAWAAYARCGRSGSLRRHGASAPSGNARWTL